jgi:hypothetical protein
VFLDWLYRAGKGIVPFKQMIGLNTNPAKNKLKRGIKSI